MKVSLLKLRNESKLYFDAHEQVKSFYWGDFIRMYTQHQIEHAVIVMQPIRVNQLGRKNIQVQLLITYASRMFSDFSNLDEIQSDALDVLADFVGLINYSPRWKDFVSGEVTGNAEVFENRTGDLVAGAVMTLTLTIKNTVDFCAQPVSGYDFNISPQEPFICAPVIYEITRDGQPFDNGSVPSGGELILNVPSAPPPPCQPVTVNLQSDSNNIQTVTAASGETVNTPIRRLGQYPLLTGSATDNTLGDNFLTLPFTNPWNNINRFTWKDGTQTYPNGVIAENNGYTIDNRTWNGSTVLGYAYVTTQRNLAGQHAEAATAVIDGLGDWHVVNERQHISLTTEIAVKNSMNYPPFNVADGTNIGNSTLNIANINQHSIILPSNGVFSLGGTGASRNTLFVREFTVTIDNNNNVILT